MLTLEQEVKWVIKSHGSDKNKLTDVISLYNGAVLRWKNDASRIPARAADNTPEALEAYAKKLWKEAFSNLLHECYTYPYCRVNPHEERRKEVAREVAKYKNKLK